MGKFGTQCCAFGCSKRRKKVKGNWRWRIRVKKEVFADISLVTQHLLNLFKVAVSFSTLQFFRLRSTKYRGGLSPQKIPEHYLNNNHVSSKFNIVVILQNVSCSHHHWNLLPPALKLLSFKYNFWRSCVPQARVSWRDNHFTTFIRDI